MNFILFVIPNVVIGWGGDAHRVVAKVASEFLRPTSRWYVLEHLGGAGLSQVAHRMMFESTWADSLSETRPELDSEHFAHIPASGNIVGRMGRKDILEAIARYTITASDPKSAKAERTEALKFLIHLMADIHSPVHIGFASDMGGTQLYVKYLKSDDTEVRTTLHEIWDSVLIEHKQNQICQDTEEAPWALSNEILKTLPDRRSTEPYALGLGKNDVRTLDNVLAISTRIANEIARDYTTKFAYGNERGGRIEQDEVLTREYLETRSEVAVELLKRAGVRLAELLNQIARAYETRRFTPSQTVAGDHAPALNNPYLVLDTEFNPDELVFNEPVEPVKEEDVNAPRSEEDARREKNRLKNERRKIKARSVDGVDFKKAVLIKRKGYYFVTSKDLVKAGEIPANFLGYTLVFSRNTDSLPIQLQFDPRLVGLKPTTRALAKCVLHIVSTKNNGTSEEIDFELIQDETNEVNENALNFQSSFPMIKSLRGEMETESRLRVASSSTAYTAEELLRMYGREQPVQDEKPKKPCAKQRRKQNAKLRNQFGGRLPSKEEIWDSEFMSKLDKVRFYQNKHIIFVVHEDTLKIRPYADIWATRTGVRMSAADPNSYFVLVDHNIYKGALTDKISSEVVKGLMTKERLSQNALRFRPSIIEELGDINTVHFETGENRLDSLKKVLYHRAFDDPDLDDLTVFIWSLRPWDGTLPKNP